jgi:hypothetical protein
MWTVKRKIFPLLTVLCVAGPAWPMGGGPGGDGGPSLSPEVKAAWGPIIEEGRRYGPLFPDWEHTATHLAAAGFAPAQGNEILEPARKAAREALPAGAVLSKLDEGAAKGVPADELRHAAEKRLEALRQARPLLAGHGFPAGKDQGGGLLVATALALESGMTAPALDAALARGRGTPPGRMKAVVEAGEALHLDGLPPETVGMLMADCVDRQLRRPEVLRVVRFAREQHSRGLDGTAIRASLWGGAGGVEGSPGAGGSGGTGGAPGSSFGPGSGGPGMGGRGGMGGDRPPRGGPR